MGRPKDEHYWNQVTKLQGDAWQCKHCGRKYRGGVSRIKPHVDQKQGQGIAPCPSAPGSVPDNEGVDNNITTGSSNPQEARNAMNLSEGVDNNIAAGSSNPQEVVTAMNSSEGWAPDDDFIGNFESDISQVKELVHTLTCEEDDMKGQLQRLESRGKKRNIQVDFWLIEIGDLRKRATDMNNSVDQFGPAEVMPLQQLKQDVRMRMEQKPLVLSNELVGEGFETNIREIWKLLGDDQVFIVGIHGMGGVGKTCLVTHIKNAITRNHTFKHVFWVNVSQKFSILKLQDDIAERIGVKLDKADERIRAEILSLALEGKEKLVLILDDVWSYIDLQKVGIPLRVNGLKLILISRLEYVCQQMDCSIIEMKLLPDDEAWELFLLKLGSLGTPATLPHDVLDIARSVAKECDGLPLGISVVARIMKGIDDILRWKHALNKLRNRTMGEEMEQEVFKVLKLSYDNLMDKNIQNCFLHCALYNHISAEKLIMNLVEEGLIDEKRSLEEIFIEGRIILDKFKGHSLLQEEEEEEKYYLSMHGLVRDMACHILKESHRYMVKCDEGLTRIPHLLEWKADLEKVSLMGNRIEKIPEGTSPWCPRLSTLIFSCNSFSSIPDCFFSHMNALAILDLSDNPKLTCLPNSVSNLRSLKSLLLRRCQSLRYVPPLGELHALSRLLISGTSIQEVPQGLEMLINLKWLDLSRNNELKLIPGSVLPRLTKMQYLDLRCNMGSTKLEVEDVQGMSMLECFAGSFQDGQNFSDYVRKTLGTGCGLKAYFLHLGTNSELEDVDEYYSGLYEDSKTVNIGDCEELLHILPPDLAELCITENQQWTRCLCDALSFNDLPTGSSMFFYLKRLEIKECDNMEKLLTPGSLRHLQNLEEIVVLSCNSMTEIFAVSNSNDDDSRITLPNDLPTGSSMFFYPNLKRLKIKECDNMEKLLTAGSLPLLRNLEEIEVESCNSMTEIFAVSNSNDDDSSITLPKLRRLRIMYLPQLKIVCRGIMVCGSYDVFKVRDCPNLQGLPIVQVFF